MLSRATLASVLLLVLPGAELSTQYKAERAVRVESKTTLKMETTKLEVLRDGEPMESRGGGSKVSIDRHEVHVDRTLASADGHASRLRRTFETVDADSKMEFGEESRDIEGDSPLEGVTLELSADKDGEVEVEVVEGDAPDTPGALKGHQIALDLDALLPDGSVEVGASWELDSKAVRRALGLEVERALFPPKEESSERGGDDRGRNRMRGSMTPFLQQAEWTGKAKLTSLDEEHDGVRCALIELQIEASGDMPEPQWGGRGRDRMFDPELAPLAPSGNTYEVKLEGKLLFALTDRLPVLFDVEGSVSTEMHMEREMRDGGSFTMDSASEGPVHYTIEVSTVKDEEAK